MITLCKPYVSGCLSTTLRHGNRWILTWKPLVSGMKSIGLLPSFRTFDIKSHCSCFYNNEDTHGIQYTASASSKYTGGGYANTGVKLSVSKSGDTYTIKSGELNYCNPFAGSDPTLYKGPAFTLISSLTPIPDGYFNSK